MNYQRGPSTSTSDVGVGDEASFEENAPSIYHGAINSLDSYDDSDSYGFEQTEDVHAQLIRRFSKEL